MNREKILDIYNLVKGILTQSTDDVSNSLYQGAMQTFDNAFFQSALGIAIAYIGFLIAFRKIKDDEAIYKMIWMILIFSFVMFMLKRNEYYIWFIDILNIPREMFVEVINTIIYNINPDIKLENILNTLMSSTSTIVQISFNAGSITNPMPYIYGGIAFLTGSFLILVIILMTLFSTFLSNIVMALFPFVIVALIWKKTEYVFISWVKLYISLSLYAPFTMIFGLVSIHVVKLSMSISQSLSVDYINSAELILILVVLQLIIIISIFKIPNIINQLIGSANEGSSMTSGVGTVSTGATMLMGVAKFSGISKASQVAAKYAPGIGKKVANQSLPSKDEVSSAYDYLRNKVKIR